MTKQPRWLKSAIAASADTTLILPWARSTRRRPQAMMPAAAQTQAAARTQACAAR